MQNLASEFLLRLVAFLAHVIASERIEVDSEEDGCGKKLSKNFDSHRHKKI